MIIAKSHLPLWQQWATRWSPTEIGILSITREDVYANTHGIRSQDELFDYLYLKAKRPRTLVWQYTSRQANKEAVWISRWYRAHEHYRAKLEKAGYTF